MLKVYQVGGRLFQYEEGEAPTGAVEADAPHNKKAVPKTKSAAPATDKTEGAAKK